MEKKWAANPENKTKSKLLNNSTGFPGDSGSTLKIPGFEISYQVGQGAMGSVYKAREIKTGTLVAIKVLSRELSLRSDLVARFEREAYALKSLKNKNVVTIMAAGQIDETHYFAMEYINGITLRARINRGPIGFEEASFITEQILNGLQAAHSHGIIHRDLKPENVLLEYELSNFNKFPDRVVLVDFGLVGIGGLAFDPHPNLTRSKVTMGTVNYMAPEQHIDAKRVDHRSDLYSAGVILFEMISGELPLGRYMMPNERGLDTPPELDILLGKALARIIEERFKDAHAFIAGLAKIKEAMAAAQAPKKPDQDSSYFGLIAKVKNRISETKYIFLFAISVLFFIYGIKLSFAAIS